MLLRVWRNGIRDPEDWRASLQDLRTREVIRFGSLEALLRYLGHRRWRSQSMPSASREHSNGVGS